MFIDIHTHVFPDEISDRAIAVLQAKADAGTGIKNCLPARTDGKLTSLKESMQKNGISASLVLPVVTRPAQFDTVNAFAAGINGIDGVYSFGGIHPECDDIEKKLDHIKSLGLRGIKLHPTYQQCDIDDPRYLKIVEYCLKADLYVLFHSGYDVASPDSTTCPPRKFAAAYSAMLEKYGESEHPHVILAHLGGLNELDESKKYLAGMPIYLDLACTLEQLETETLMDIIKAHGAEKILFASDSPWQDQGKCAERLMSLPLTDEEKELISHKNAERILSL